MINTKTIRVGIVGASPNYGWAKRAQIPALMSLPEFEIAAVCTSNPETAIESAKHFRIAKAFHDYRELVKDPQIDLISVCVRAPLHHDVVMAALKAGKHVYCEWPLAANLSQAEQMAAAARKSGVRHMVGLQGRCDPAVLRLRQLFKEGYVGQVLGCNMSLYVSGTIHLNTRNTWEAERSNGAHALSIGGGHTLDILTFCLGDFAEISAQVSTQLRHRRVQETEDRVAVTSPDHILITGYLESGAAASASIAYIPWQGSGWNIEIYGTNGTLRASSISYPQLSAVEIKGGRGGDKSLQEIPFAGYHRGTFSGIEPLAVAEMFKRLYKGIIQGEGVTPNFEDGLKLHRLLEVIQRSSDQGRKVRVG
jgi:predicted dehydrogenase